MLSRHANGERDALVARESIAGFCVAVETFSKARMNGDFRSGDSNLYTEEIECENAN